MAANLLQLDKDLAEDVVFIIGGKTTETIKFQFPPKILVDNRTGSWDEVELPGDQPVSIYKTSGARKLSLEWAYVIGATAGWDVDTVRQQILHLRGYYTKKEGNILVDNFIVKFRIWKLGGEKEMTFRLGNIDIAHGKALYVPYGNVKLAHPVITNIKVAMQPWTKGSDKEKTDKILTGKYKDSDSDVKSKIDVEKLEGVILTGWQ
jgi:hypothetical protein